MPPTSRSGLGVDRQADNAASRTSVTSRRSGVALSGRNSLHTLLVLSREYRSVIQFFNTLPHLFSCKHQLGESSNTAKNMSALRGLAVGT